MEKVKDSFLNKGNKKLRKQKKILKSKENKESKKILRN